MNDFWENIIKIDLIKLVTENNNDFDKIRKIVRDKIKTDEETYKKYNEIIQCLTFVLRDAVMQFFRKKSKHSMIYYELKHGMFLSDDRLWYLCSYIVTLGKSKYMSCIQNPKKIFKYKNFCEEACYLFKNH